MKLLILLILLTSGAFAQSTPNSIYELILEAESVVPQLNRRCDKLRDKLESLKDQAEDLTSFEHYSKFLGSYYVGDGNEIHFTKFLVKVDGEVIDLECINAVAVNEEQAAKREKRKKDQQESINYLRKLADLFCF